MWTALPSSEYYGASAPSRRHQPTVGLAALPRWVRGRVRRHRDGSHVHRSPIGGGGVQLYPCSIAPGYRSPPRSLGMRNSKPHTEMGANSKGAPSAAHGPDPSGFEPPTCQGASTTGSICLHLPASLAGPGRLMVPTRPYFVTAAPARSRTSGVGLPSASPDHCDGQGRVSQPARSIGASWRTRVEVQREPIAGAYAQQLEGSPVHRPQGRVQRPDVAQGEPAEERPRGLRRWGGEPPELRLHVVAPGHGEVVAPRAIASDMPRTNCSSMRPRARFFKRRCALTARVNPRAFAAAR